MELRILKSSVATAVGFCVHKTLEYIKMDIDTERALATIHPMKLNVNNAYMYIDNFFPSPVGQAIYSMSCFPVCAIYTHT